VHWSEQYIGRPYKLGEADCAALCIDVIENEFSGEVPDFCKTYRENTRLKRAEQLEELAKQATQKTETPSEGDIVLMRCRGRPSHVGIYCLVDNESSVLHAMENAKMVVRHKLRDLPRYFLEVEGFYKWNKQNSVKA
jgi:cell wall-associated NlpC family hydrolase